MPTYLTIIIFMLNFCSNSNAQTKIWIPTTNYEDPKNWLAHRQPCSSSQIIFPFHLNAAIYLSSNIKVKEIQLPYDGELCLKENSAIQIGNDIDSICKNTVVYFKEINIEPWLKAGNWKLVKDSKAIPHIEQVPCIYDNVIFPKESSFWVQYPEIPLSVNNFNIDGKNLTNEQLQYYLLSEPGTRQFKHFDFQIRSDVIRVEKIRCTEQSGCLCHPNQNDILQFVCKTFNCNIINHCFNPVTPIGHCCQICGAYILFKYDRINFQLDELKETVSQQVNVSGYNSVVEVHISKVLDANNEQMIQIVIVEKDNYKGHSVDAATLLHHQLTAHQKQFKLLDSKLFISGSPYWPGSQLKTTTAIVFGSLLIVLIFFSSVAYYYIYGSDQNKFAFSFRPFLFVRFENNGDDSLEFRNRSVASSLDRSFHNPLYNAAEESSSTMIDPIEKINFKSLLHHDRNDDRSVSEE